MADDDNVIQFPGDPGSNDRGRERAPSTGPAASGTDAAGLLAHLGALGIDLGSLPPYLQTVLADSLAAEAADAPGASFGLGALLGQIGQPGTAPFGVFPGRQPELLPRREDVATYRIRIDLDDVRPPVWRRIDVPSDLPLHRLHAVVQAAMGWWDSHLHAFVMGPDSRDRDTAPFLTAFDVEEGDTGMLENDVRLDEVLGEPGHRLFYTYDFGDDWEHTLKLEKVLPTGPAGCVGGRRACPPEDCGGIPGYEDIVALHEGREPSGYGPNDREEMLEWLPEGWDPDEFDREAADEAVRIVVDGGTPGLPPVEELNPALGELLRRARGTGEERRLVAMTLSALADTPGGVLGVDSEEAGPDEATIVAAMRPLQVVLDVVGDGVDLTAAGYLRPAAVEGIAAGIDLGSTWIGKANREDLTPPIAQLRTAAQRLGLVRRHRGRLLPTTAGRRVRTDAAGLWRHVAEHLPTGSAQQRDPAILLLLAVAGGGVPPEFSSVCHEVLGVVGWREGRFTHEQFTDALAPTWETLEALGCFERGGAGAATDLGMDLATAALRPG